LGCSALFKDKEDETTLLGSFLLGWVTTGFAFEQKEFNGLVKKRPFFVKLTM